MSESNNNANYSKFDENLIFGRIGENFIERILINSGYIVHNFGFENSINDTDSLQIEQTSLEKTTNTISRHTAMKVRKTPDFLVLNKEIGFCRYVEVKTTTRFINMEQDIQEDSEVYRDFIQPYITLWPDTIIVLVNLTHTFITTIDLSKQSNGTFYFQSSISTFPSYNKNMEEKILTKTSEAFKPKHIKEQKEINQSHEAQINSLHHDNVILEKSRKFLNIDLNNEKNISKALEEEYKKTKFINKRLTLFIIILILCLIISVSYIAHLEHIYLG